MRLSEQLPGRDMMSGIRQAHGSKPPLLWTMNGTHACTLVPACKQVADVHLHVADVQIYVYALQLSDQLNHPRWHVQFQHPEGAIEKSTKF